MKTRNIILILVVVILCITVFYSLQGSQDEVAHPGQETVDLSKVLGGDFGRFRVS